MCTIQFFDIEFVFHEYKTTTSEHLLCLWVAEFESIVIWSILGIDFHGRHRIDFLSNLPLRLASGK